tara:strand:+ start:574 stop:726 length:153 start_codon:yes stop_codon:yes gene_type:complete
MSIDKDRRKFSLFLFSLPLLPVSTKLKFINDLGGSHVVNKGGWLLDSSDK